MQCDSDSDSMSTIFPVQSVSACSVDGDDRVIGRRYFPLTDYLFSKWFICLIPVALAVLVLPFEIVYTLVYACVQCLFRGSEP